MKTKIEANFKLIHKNLATINGTMKYDDITLAIIEICGLIYKAPNSDSDDIWNIGKGFEFDLGDLLSGAFRHYGRWHGCEDSTAALALSVLGTLFSPGMGGPPDQKRGYDQTGENLAFQLLNEMAESEVVL